MVTTLSTIPPNEGMAIGSIMSAPFPVDVKTGSKANMVVAVVIIAGLTLLLPPQKTASRILFFVVCVCMWCEGVWFARTAVYNSRRADVV